MNKFKTFLLAVASFSLFGCSSLNTALEPMVNVEKRCYTLPNGEIGTNKETLECMVKEMKKRDEARRKFGLVAGAGIYENKLKQLNSFEETFNSKHEIAKNIKKKEDEYYKVLEENKIRDRCLLISDAQLEEKLYNAYVNGNYSLYDKLRSNEYKERIIKHCIDESKK